VNSSQQISFLNTRNNFIEVFLFTHSFATETLANTFSNFSKSKILSGSGYLDPINQLKKYIYIMLSNVCTFVRNIITMPTNQM